MANSLSYDIETCLTYNFGLLMFKDLQGNWKRIPIPNQGQRKAEAQLIAEGITEFNFTSAEEVRSL